MVSHGSTFFCLNWVLNNQREQGFWGDCGNGHGRPTIESLPATLACLIVLRRWNSGKPQVEKGLAFVNANVEKLLEENYGRFPRCEELVDKHHYPPLLSYIEALSFYDINREDIVKNLSDDGSLFQSPSATARAFMATGNEKCLAHLQSLVQRCPNGDPPRYPVYEDLIKLCVVNRLQWLGLAEHFIKEIEEVLAQVYRATDFMVPEEYEVQEARLFSRKSLEKIISLGKIRGQDNSSFPSFHKVV
ncbi:hypothetical protein Ddye_019340 [Dipteronia dyeriana]|uniref:Terpene synthase N-terminal domain-containing protein n=1 Tax=Dipteronia dyeriana TaxID=168575 RepID=A0AAD9WVX9_9ROSI|nr:hypothetical protein Ddye_019340 [Dipteronia dyeriana]